MKHVAAEMDAAGREYYRLLSEEGRLATTRCDACERTSFPPRERCAGCGGRQGWVDLPLRGRLHAFTTQETALRFRAPEVLALCELGEAVVPGIADGPYERLRIGQEVDVELRQEPETGLTLLFFRSR